MTFRRNQHNSVSGNLIRISVEGVDFVGIKCEMFNSSAAAKFPVMLNELGGTC